MRDNATGKNPQQDEELLMPGEVARLFGVDPKTVARWADAGVFEARRTAGGHRRYRAREVYALLSGNEHDVGSGSG